LESRDVERPLRATPIPARLIRQELDAWLSLAVRSLLRDDACSAIALFCLPPLLGATVRKPVPRISRVRSAQLNGSAAWDRLTGEGVSTDGLERSLIRVDLLEV
jgi:hypothetical protein